MDQSLDLFDPDMGAQYTILPIFTSDRKPNKFISSFKQLLFSPLVK